MIGLVVDQSSSSATTNTSRVRRAHACLLPRPRPHHFDTREEEKENFPWAKVSQDMSLRYLGNWDLDDGFALPPPLLELYVSDFGGSDFCLYAQSKFQ